jgi:hypothetical protein
VAIGICRGDSTPHFFSGAWGGRGLTVGVVLLVSLYKLTCAVGLAKGSHDWAA